jgi:hypothetical protein
MAAVTAAAAAAAAAPSECLTGWVSSYFWKPENMM